MACNKCWVEEPKLSKFCRHCGEPLGIRVKCPQCGAEDSADSLFCIVCGARLLQTKKPAKRNQRKCTSCGHFNELEAAYCIVCGEQVIRAPKENFKRKSDGPSFKTIGLLIGVVLLIGVLIKAGTIFFKAESSSARSSSRASISGSIDVDEAQVIAVAKNFKCACGRCGELPLATCNCDMPLGSVEEKRFIRERLTEGYTEEQVIELLDKKYGHRA
jgi:cytochrome c-type biogenesis protein CcmH/NrfF